MIKITINETDNKKISKTYDKIFKIIDDNTFLFKVYSESEHRGNEGYIIEFNSLSNEMIQGIEKLKNVSIEL